ncbi:MAG: BatA domain-containing protein [Planctomycetes bacterium]|nr:BatA domain-containing protein [Planctomycetota bacterium]
MTPAPLSSLLPLGALMNPALAGFAALLAIPLVIHLLNRRRYRTVPWAAMEFLLAAYQKRRKKLQVENLLLLLLRCAIPVILALAFARPYFGKDSVLAGIGELKREVIVVLDESYSMSRRVGNGTLFQAALEQSRRLLAGLKSEREDRVTLLTFGREPRLQCVSAGFADFERKLSALARPQHERGDLARALDLLLDEVLDKQVLADPEVWLLSDFQALTFDDLAAGIAAPAADPTASDGATADASAGDGSLQGSLAGSLVARLRKLGERSTLHLVNLTDGALPPENAAVTDLRASESLAIQGQALRLTASVTRQGRAQSGSGRFRIGDLERPVNFRYDAEGKASVELYHSCSTEGDLGVEFRLDEDELADDDARFLRLPVKQSLPVLVVDGAPSGGDPLAGSAGGLLLILDPLWNDLEAADHRRWFQPTVVPWYDLSRTKPDFAKYDAVIFVDVREIEAERVLPELTAYVEGGGGVLFLLGEEVRGETWNERLWKGDGSGLLPLRLGAEPLGEAYDPASGSARRDAPFRLEIADELHPAIRTFADDRRRLYLRFPIFRYWPFDPEPAGGYALPKDARIVLRHEGSGAPALIDHRVGRGRTLWLNLSGVDDGWSNFARTASAYFPLVWDMLNFLCLRDPGDHELPIGGAIVRGFPAPPRSASITAPGGVARTFDSSPREAVRGLWRLEPYSDTRVPGLYALDVQFDGDELPVHELFAVNLDPTESDLRCLEREAVESLLARVKHEYHAREIPTDVAEQAPERQGEIWKRLVLALLVLLLLETLLAWRFGAYSA